MRSATIVFSLFLISTAARAEDEVKACAPKHVMDDQYFASCEPPASAARYSSYKNCSIKLGETNDGPKDEYKVSTFKVWCGSEPDDKARKVLGPDAKKDGELGPLPPIEVLASAFQNAGAVWVQPAQLKELYRMLEEARQKKVTSAGKQKNKDGCITLMHEGREMELCPKKS